MVLFQSATTIPKLWTAPLGMLFSSYADKFWSALLIDTLVVIAYASMVKAADNWFKKKSNIHYSAKVQNDR